MEEKYVYQLNTEYPATLNNFLQYLNLNKKRSQNTIETYARHIVEFMKYIKLNKGWIKEKDIKKVKVRSFTDTELRKVTVDDIEDYIQYCSSALDNSSGTLSNKISALDTFFKYLVRKRIKETNLIDAIERPEIEQKVVEYISVEEVNQLLNAIKNSNDENSIRNYALYNLYVNSGARLSELADLKLDKLNLQANTILIKGKGNKERIIDLNDNCIKALNEYLIIREKIANRSIVKDKDILFLSRKGGKLSSVAIETNLKKYGKMIGLELHPHMLRHTAATIMYQNGVSIYDIKEILGHSNIQTTTIYAKVSNEQKKKAVNAIAEALGR